METLIKIALWVFIIGSGLPIVIGILVAVFGLIASLFNNDK